MDCVLGEILWSGLQTKDTILAAAIEQYETTAKDADVDVDGNCSSTPPLRPQTRVPPLLWTVELEARFAGPKTDLEIKHAREQGIPKKNIEDTRYCLRVWKAWRDHRNSTTIIQKSQIWIK